MKQWDTEHTEQNHYDPTEILSRMAELLEKETHAFMARDPGQSLPDFHKIRRTQVVITNLVVFRPVRGPAPEPGGPGQPTGPHSQGLLQEGKFSARGIQQLHARELLHPGRPRQE